MDTGKTYNITLLGCGKMGRAMLDGWLSREIVNRVLVVDPHESNVPDAPQISYCADFPDHVERYNDILVIAVKPQIIADALDTVDLPDGMAVLSIAAGQSLDTLQSYFSGGTGIIRSMPNTPAAIGKGISVAIANEYVTDEQKTCAGLLLRAVGDVEWITNENLMDAVTALSGSGPAYVFYLIECLSQAGVDIGLDAGMATKLARQTVIGSAALAEHDALVDASLLRKNVTSPNGTTQAALDVLMDGRFQNILLDTLRAAQKRSVELNNT